MKICEPLIKKGIDVRVEAGQVVLDGLRRLSHEDRVKSIDYATRNKLAILRAFGSQDIPNCNSCPAYDQGTRLCHGVSYFKCRVARGIPADIAKFNCPEKQP